MADHLNSRRQLLRVAAMGTLAVPAVAVFAESALAYQGNMERAISALRCIRCVKQHRTKAATRPRPST